MPVISRTVYRSDITRANPDLNVQPNFYPALTGGLQGGDPFTPMMRAYEADKVQVRILVGAHEESHNFNIHGQKWLYERSDPNSGYRNSQSMGISEHFEFELPGIRRSRAASRSSITCISRAVPWITSGTVHGDCCAPIVARRSPAGSSTAAEQPDRHAKCCQQ